MKTLLPLAAALLLAAPAMGSEALPENEQVRVVTAVKTDCYIYQAECLRVTLECKRFIPRGRPVLRVSWHDADGTAFYTVVKHVTGAAHCNLGDLIHRYAPWYEGKRYELTLP